MSDHHNGGFSLVELSVVLVIIGVVGAYALAASAAYLNASLLKLSQQRVMAADQALTLFVARNKRLPCPADGALADAAAAAGHEALAAAPDTTNCATSLSVRVLPWRDLGMDRSDAVDGWGHRLSYHVFNGPTGLTQPGGMDMSATVAAASDNTAPASWLLNKGFAVNDEYGNVLLSPADATKGGGAAFLLISNGRDGAGSYSSSGQAMPLPPPIETSRAADAGFAVPFIAATFNDATAGAANFFDFVIDTPTIHSIAVAANLGPQ